MYNLPYFKEKDQKVLDQFIRDHPFATLIGCHNNIPVATQVPLLIEVIDEKLYFEGHIMKNTDHHKAFLNNPDVLCLFTGAHTYVSGSWYEDPHTASTWNYMSIHARGTISFLEEDRLREILQRTTLHFEKDHASPTVFENLSEDYIQKLIKAIVGFKIEVKTMDNVFKLSQNRNEKSYENIINNLQTKDADAMKIAEEMKCRFASQFNNQNGSVIS